MGRYVISQCGNLDWEWKFGFASQCSNFGFIMEKLANPEQEIYVNRYTGEDGEFVVLGAEKQQLLEAIETLLKKINACPVCGDEECLQDTKEMLKDLKQRIEENSDDDIDATWFVEYI